MSIIQYFCQTLIRPIEAVLKLHGIYERSYSLKVCFVPRGRVLRIEPIDLTYSDLLPAHIRPAHRPVRPTLLTDSKLNFVGVRT
jgi:hypothetical protein